MIKFDCAFGLSILIIVNLISSCLESIEQPQKSSLFSRSTVSNWFMGGECTVNYTHDRQIPHISELKFIEGLSQVWKRTAEVCVPSAHPIIRFGVLPSLASNPTLLLRESLKKACGG